MYNYSIFEQGDCVREFIKAGVGLGFGFIIFLVWKKNAFKE